MSVPVDLVVGGSGTRLRRILMLYSGLVLGGVGLSMFFVADLGLDAWDVLHQGISISAGISVGTAVVASSVGVLFLWVPLRQRPGLGTVSDVFVVGVVIDVALSVMPHPGSLGMRVVFLAAGLVTTAIATSMYIGAGLGPGPRDGLMTGIAARGWTVRRVRTTLDVSVLAVGWFLGGTVGVGTVASALTMGPLVHVFLPRFMAVADRAPVGHVSPTRRLYHASEVERCTAP